MEKHPREVGIYQEVRIYQNGTTMVRIVTSKTGYKRRIYKKIMTDFFFYDAPSVTQLLKHLGRFTRIKSHH